ncbi:MAG: hypothetical protein ACRDBO_11285 [Lachnospiraceae bacterium]
MKITEESNLPQQEPNPPAEPDSRSELEKLKDMSWKDRLWYIGEYYKFHMIGAAILIFLAVSIGTTIYQGSFPTVYHSIYMNSSTPMDINTEPLQQGFASYLELAPKERIITETISIPVDNPSSELDFASMAKVSATIAAKSLDSIIGDRDSLEYFAAMSGCVDLEEVLPTETYVQVKDYLVYAKGEDDISRAYGIDLSGTDFAAESGLGMQMPILYIISNSTHIDTSLALVDYIFLP